VFKSGNNGESFDFELTGIGEEPLAEKYVKINCNAREVAEVGDHIYPLFK